VIVSHELFMWVVTALAVGICVGWGARDIYLLRKNLSRAGRAAAADPAVWRDQIFGSIIGLVTCGLGLYGALRYHLHR